MASSLAIPRDSGNVPVGMGIWNNGGTPVAAWLRILGAGVLTTEETPSGPLAVGGGVAHDGADVAAYGPAKIGGFGKDAAPSNVSADGDIVNAWFARNGAQMVNLTAAGALIGGDATNGLDVDVTRQTGELVDDAAFTPGTSKIIMAGFEADEGSTDSVDEGDGGAARMTLDRKIIVSSQAHTKGGATPYSALSTAAVLTAEIKGSAGQIYSFQGFNKGAAAVYARLYNQTGAPGSGDAANIIWRGIIPGATTGAGYSIPIPVGIECGTGIGIRVSGAIADNDTTSLSANEVEVNVQYK